MNETVHTLVIGGGQAGVATSAHLQKHGVPHLVLERDRIAERWRSWRWDSLVANGPAWHDRFPEAEFSDLDPDAFAPKEAVADYSELSVLPTRQFLYGLKLDEETEVNLERGKNLLLKIQAIGEADDRGMRQVVCAVNGQVRMVSVATMAPRNAASRCSISRNCANKPPTSCARRSSTRP